MTDATEGVFYGAVARAMALAADDPDWMNVTRWPRQPEGLVPYGGHAPTAEIDALDLRAEVATDLTLLEFVGCQFFACEGPDKEPEDMVTCRVCGRIRELRALLTRVLPPGKGQS